MKRFALTGEMDAGVFAVECGAHSMTPTRARIMPAIGASGMSGHKMMRMRLMKPLKMIMMTPAMSKKRRETKPTVREMRRSKNI